MEFRRVEKYRMATIATTTAHLPTGVWASDCGLWGEGISGPAAAVYGSINWQSAASKGYDYIEQSQWKWAIGADFVPVGATRHERVIDNRGLLDVASVPLT